MAAVMTTPRIELEPAVTRTVRRVAPRPVARCGHRPPAAIYWRRRAVALLVLAVVVLAARAVLGVLGGGPLTTSGAPAGRSGAATYVVQPGDTFWTIADRVHPDGDVRGFVDRLSAAHGGRPLQPGERLALP